MKRYLKFMFMVTALCLVFGATGVFADTEDTSGRLQLASIDLSDDYYPESMALLSIDESKADAIVKYIHDAVWEGYENISLTDGGFGNTLSTGDFTTITSRLYHMPDLFVCRQYSYSYGSNGYVVDVKPVYTEKYIDSKDDSKVDYSTAKNDYVARLNEIVAQADNTWNSVEKVLFVNDYLCVNYKYDMRLYSESGTESRNAYDMMVDKTAVCQGYSLLGKAILDKLNVETHCVTSNSMNHMWNIVKIGDKWYHVDFTYDDPTVSKTSIVDYPGYASHAYFLKSSDAMKGDYDSTEGKYPHFESDDWVYGKAVSCNDTSYDNYFWKDAVSPFVYYGEDAWYYLDADGLKKWDGTSSSGQKNIDFESVYATLYGSSNFNTNITGSDGKTYKYRLGSYLFNDYVTTSGLFQEGKQLCFNTRFNILKFDPTIALGSGNPVVIVDISNQHDRALYGCEYNISKADNEKIVNYLEYDSTITATYFYQRLSEKSVPFAPYTSVTAGLYEYKVENGKLFLRLSEGATVVAALYENTGGKLKSAELVKYVDLADSDNKASVQLSGKQFKIFSYDASGNKMTPRCEAVSGTIST